MCIRLDELAKFLGKQDKTCGDCRFWVGRCLKKRWNKICVSEACDCFEPKLDTNIPQRGMEAISGNEEISAKEAETKPLRKPVSVSSFVRFNIQRRVNYCPFKHEPGNPFCHFCPYACEWMYVKKATVTI